MPAIEDIKKLPKDEPQLKKYTMYGLLFGLALAVMMAIWFLIRYNKSGGDISWVWSLVHLVGYIALAAFVCSALYGFFYGKSQFLLWFIFTVIAMIVLELVCIIWNQMIGLIIKINVMVVFGVIAGLVFFWRRMLDSKSSLGKPVDVVEKAEKVGPQVPEPETKGTKAGEALIKSDKNKNKK